MKSLGIDVGSSSVKVSLLDIKTGRRLVSSTNPSYEMPIKALKPGWAEQNPEMWWKYVCDGIRKVHENFSFDDLACIGVTYQMHGLVCLDQSGHAIRDSIIWCDSRAVAIGREAENFIGTEKCLEQYLNSPGNFTASKLAWVKENEPEKFSRIHKFMLPGDFIAYKLSGYINTTVTGLSEQILWNFKKNRFADEVAGYYRIPNEIVPEIVPSVGIQARTSTEIEDTLGIPSGTPISYRAGDQPNNAFSLNVLDTGEVAATGGTSGVVYGVLDHPEAEKKSRVNTFIHVNHTNEKPRLGVLLCINGTGIMNAWIRRNFTPSSGYVEMNEMASQIPAGSEGVTVLPFGNGAERMLENSCPGASIDGLDFNRHSIAHVIRATQEGIAFSFKYGIDIMKSIGLRTDLIRAGKANLFLSPVFRQTLSTICNAKIELYDTDGSLGAARGAALGAGIYHDREETFSTLKITDVIEPKNHDSGILEEVYDRWKNIVIQKTYQKY